MALDLNLSDDVLGVGKLTQGAGGTAMCGSRPNCIGNGKNCQDKRNKYQECVLASIQAQQNVGIAQAQAQAQATRNLNESSKDSFFEKYKTYLIVGGVVLLVILLIRR